LQSLLQELLLLGRESRNSRLRRCVISALQQSLWKSCSSRLPCPVACLLLLLLLHWP
jgi:hypothetical protein